MQPPLDPISNPMAGRLLRVFWLFVGSAVVYASWVAIVLTSAPVPSVFDGVVWLTICLMVLARRIDIQRFAGRTAKGEPTTMADWHRYVAILVGSGAVGSLVAHFLGGSLTT